jgi:hypothetical protein
MPFHFGTGYSTYTLQKFSWYIFVENASSKHILTLFTGAVIIFPGLNQKKYSMFHNEELHNLHISPNITTVIKLRMRWEMHGANMEEWECIQNFASKT